MKHVGWGLLVYFCFALDLHGGLRRGYGLAPAMLDLALLMVLVYSKSASRVLWGAAIGYLASFTLGTSAGIECMAAGTVAGLVSFLEYRQSSSGRPVRLRLALILGYAMILLVRSGEVFWMTRDAWERELALWKLLGTSALTVLFLAVVLTGAELIQGKPGTSQHYEFH